MASQCNFGILKRNVELSRAASKLWQVAAIRTVSTSSTKEQGGDGTGRDGGLVSSVGRSTEPSRRTDEIRALVGLEYAVPIRVRKGDIWK